MNIQTKHILVEANQDFYKNGDYTDLANEFEDLLNKLSDKQWWDYVSEWKDPEEIQKQMLNWDAETKWKELENLRKMVKKL